MKKFTKKALIEHLFKSDKQDIIKEIMILFEKFENVKEYYKAELSDSNRVLETYKKKITNAYSAGNPSERRTNMNVNKLIVNFKRIYIYRNEFIEILLHRAECGVEAFNRNSKRSETFYNCIVNSFKEAVKIIVSEKNVYEYEQRISTLIKNSVAGNYHIKERMESIVLELKANFIQGSDINNKTYLK